MKLLRILTAIAVVATVLSACKNAGTAGKEGTPELKDWELVWADEFDYTGLPDSTAWDYDVGGHGWGNQEKQYYTKARTENARVENGVLIIEARKEAMDQ
jgi:hypothetical protein